MKLTTQFNIIEIITKILSERCSTYNEYEISTNQFLAILIIELQDYELIDFKDVILSNRKIQNYLFPHWKTLKETKDE